MISSLSPGKLYIAGEYAVVEKGYPSIIVAIDQFIKVSLKPAEKRGSIQAFDNSPITFERIKENLVLDYRDNRLSYVINSINVVEALAKELGKTLKLYDLNVVSELENIDGKKYGLGSSAAVTVSTIKVLCKFYNIEMTNLKLFKLAAIVHSKINSNGSGGDLAASIYGGWISFKTYDKEWLNEKIKELSIDKLLEINWPYLEINKLDPPRDLKLLIGWTGKPSSTTLLVDNVNKNKENNRDFYSNFLSESKTCVDKMIKAFENKDITEIQKQIAVNRDLLIKLSKKLNVEIETPKLTKLCDIALNFNGAAKSSGAGGGDCGVALFNKDVDTEKLIIEWKQAGISYLPLNVYFKGEVT